MVINGSEFAPPEEILDAGERSLQRFLRFKPPPNYVPRALRKSKSPQDEEAWIKVVRGLDGPTEVYEKVDLLNLQGSAISNINLKIFRKVFDTLDKPIQLLRAACETSNFFASREQRAQAVECLSYLLTERSLGWLSTIGGALTADSPQLLEALAQVQSGYWGVARLRP